MDTNALNNDDDGLPAEDALPQPTSSKVSAVLNGLGNGIMLGGAVFAVPRVIAALSGNKLPQSMNNLHGTVFATVVGSALGTWYGLHEAKQVEEYRDSIANALDSTRNRVHTLEAKVSRLQAENDNMHRKENERIGHVEKIAAARQSDETEVTR